MAKIIDLISDSELRLSKANISDDFQIDRRLIRSWLDDSRANLIRMKFKEEGMVGLESFLTEYECVPIEEKDKHCPDGCSDVEYVVNLEAQPIVLDGNDIGLYRVETQGGQTIYRTKLSEKNRMKKLRFAKPSRKNIVYYRSTDKLRISGGTDNFKKGGKVFIWMAIDDTSNLDENEQYPISADLIDALLEMVEQKGLRVLGTIEDRDNDGVQPEIKG
jgi:hypothetical protein